ncbi:MAG: LTA synthase family protein [Saccharofermentans sp.]|nr:LTA synthase family protein [Saccharofermentans sp.]
MDRYKKTVTKFLTPILKADGFLNGHYIYHILLILTVCIVVFMFRDSFYSDKIFRNYRQDDATDLKIAMNMTYNMSFEAQADSLSSFRIFMDPEASRLKSTDKMHITILNDENMKLFETDQYLYNSDRKYIRVDVDGLDLEPGDWYYVLINFSQMSPTSLLVLDSHQVNSFSEAVQYAEQGTDDDNDTLSLDKSIGFSKVPNISYYYGSVNFLSVFIHLVFFAAVMGIPFLGVFKTSTAIRNMYRIIVFPVFVYLVAEVMNIEKDRPLNFLYINSLKKAFTVLSALLLLAMLLLLVHMLTGHGSVAAFVVAIPFIVLAFVNHSKLVMRGDSFMPWDLMVAGIGLKTGSTYYFRVTPNFIAGILLCISVLMIIRLSHTPYIRLTSQRMSMVAFSVVAVLLIFTTAVFNTSLLKRLHVYYEVNPPIQSYNENGTYMAFLMHLNNLEAKGGDNSTPENAQELIYTYTGLAASMDLDSRVNDPSVRPNVICIMSEAYADLRNIRDFNTTEPVMPYYDSLMGECMHGDLAVSIFGGGTCNTEFEFLTGYSMSYLLPGSSVYSLYVNSPIDALPQIYRDNGYRTVALHSFDGSWWDRQDKYPMLGFDEFITRDDFDPNCEYVRRYISDRATFEMLTSIYEESEEPLFLFCVTMQNHADFADHYDNMHYDIHVTNPVSPTGEPFNYADNYLSLLRESDDALEYLIEYLRTSDEPTIVVFFGDHCPTLSPDFYEELLQTDLGGITIEDSVPIYETPYFIWANYNLGSGGTTINTRAGDRGITSPNFLGQTVLDLSGIYSPESRSCLRVLQQRIGAMSSLGIFDPSGALHTDLSFFDDETLDTLDDYSNIQYYLIYPDSIVPEDEGEGS